MKISTGFKEFDECINGGFECPSVVVLGGRPAMGKTAFLLTLCLNWEEQKIPYMFISRELSNSQVLKRTDDQIPEKYIWECRGRGVADVDSICEFIDNSSEIKIFIIDYIQLLMTGKYSDPYIELSEIMNKLKRCSIENEVCIILASQLSRKVEERPGHRPIMSDFRDSGAVEEVSDLVLFLLRRDYYDSNDKPGTAEIIVAKNRFGGDGSVNFTFDKNEGDFFEYTQLRPKISMDAEAEEAFSHFSI